MAIKIKVHKIYKLIQNSPSVYLKDEKHGKILSHKDTMKLIDYLEDIEDYWFCFKRSKRKSKSAKEKKCKED